MAIEVPCPKCHGKKTMNDPEYIGKVMFYSGPNGERCPQVTCITCQGVGHVLDHSSPYSVDHDAVKKRANPIEPTRSLIDVIKGFGKAKKPEPTVEELKEQLQEAVLDQRYERAAEIRDEIKRRENTTNP